ncbi:hypothetical protein KPH14_012820, partial [Odynerus spinipes]
MSRRLLRHYSGRFGDMTFSHWIDSTSGGSFSRTSCWMRRRLRHYSGRFGNMAFSRISCGMSRRLLRQYSGRFGNMTFSLWFDSTCRGFF